MQVFQIEFLYPFQHKIDIFFQNYNNIDIINNNCKKNFHFLISEALNFNSKLIVRFDTTSELLPFHVING